MDHGFHGKLLNNQRVIYYIYIYYKHKKEKYVKHIQHLKNTLNSDSSPAPRHVVSTLATPGGFGAGGFGSCSDRWGRWDAHRNKNGNFFWEIMGNVLEKNG